MYILCIIYYTPIVYFTYINTNNIRYVYSVYRLNIQYIYTVLAPFFSLFCFRLYLIQWKLCNCGCYCNFILKCYQCFQLAHHHLVWRPIIIASLYIYIRIYVCTHGLRIIFIVAHIVNWYIYIIVYIIHICQYYRCE